MAITILQPPAVPRKPTSILIKNPNKGGDRPARHRNTFLARRTVSFDLPQDAVAAEVLPTKWTDYGEFATRAAPTKASPARVSTAKQSSTKSSRLDARVSGAWFADRLAQGSRRRAHWTSCWPPRVHCTAPMLARPDSLERCSKPDIAPVEPQLGGEEIWADENANFAAQLGATPTRGLDLDSSLDRTLREDARSETPPPPLPVAEARVRRAAGMSDTVGEVYTVQLQKSANAGLGLNIAGGLGTTFGAVFISKIFPDTPADKSLIISVGDRLLAVQHASTVAMTQHDVVQALKTLKTGTVELELMRIGDRQWREIQREAGVTELRVADKQASPAQVARLEASQLDFPPPVSPPRPASALAAIAPVRSPARPLQPVHQLTELALQATRAATSPIKSEASSASSSPKAGRAAVLRPSLTKSAAQSKMLPEPPVAGPRLSRIGTPYQAELQGGSSSSSLSSDVVTIKKPVPRVARKLPAPPKKQAV